MMIIKYICLIIYLAIMITFTVGYSASPIVSASSTVANPQNTAANISGTTTFFISNFTALLGDAKNSFTQNSSYSDLTIGGVADTFIKALLYTCIISTCLIAVGIVIALFGFTFISKIIFFLALLLMIGASILIILFIMKSTFVTTMLSYFSISNNNNSSNTSNNITVETGGTLIMVSTGVMMINYIIYTLLA